MVNEIYFNKGQKRKEQIYNWFVDNINSDPSLNSRLNEVKITLSSRDIEGATQQFKELVLAFNGSGIENTLAYLIESNIERFGINIIIRDLFKGVLGRTLRQVRISQARIDRSKLPRARTKTVQELSREIKIKKVKRTFGLAKQKRKLATVKTVIIKGKPQLRLVDKKTGRFLSFTKSFRKQVQKGRIDGKRNL